MREFFSAVLRRCSFHEPSAPSLLCTAVPPLFCAAAHFMRRRLFFPTPPGVAHPPGK